MADIDLNIRARTVNAKLSADVVKQIKIDINHKLGSKSKRQITFELADRYDTSVGTITGIMYNVNWKHITIN